MSLARILLLLTVLVPPLGIVDASAGLLPAEQAFKFSAERLTDRIRVRWDIADGYYMYRDKIAFKLNDDDTSISTTSFPAGITKRDLLFGEVQVFVENFTTDIPITANNTSFDLIATAQGCNEPVGVCYPPMSRKIQFPALGDEALITGSAQQSASSVASSDAGDSNLLDNLRSLLATGYQQADFMDVDDAFKLDIQPIQQGKIKVAFEIADGYYLYRHAIKFSNDGENRIQRVVLPQGKVNKDAYFGEVSVFKSSFSFPVELNDQNNGDNNLIIHASYQGCAEDSVCYSPVNKSFDVSALAVRAIATNLPTLKSDTNTVQQPTDKTLLSLLLGAFFAGVLLTFTPCVLPMIPILSSVIIGQSRHLTRVRGGIIASSYVLGSAVAYAGIGALAGAAGDQLQAYFQNIWAIGALSTLLFVMALSMFGLFKIQMPDSIQSKILAKTNNLHRTAPLVFLLGLVSALIVGACVSPILISFLGIAITIGDPLLGAQIMIAVAIGMGLPLIALGLGLGHVIPRTGIWMENIKRGFGVTLIVVAIYLLGSIPQVPILLFWGSFFIIISIFMGATDKIPEKVPAKIANWLRFEKGLGIILLVWGILLIVGGLLGQRDILRPLPPNLLSSPTGMVSTTTNAVKSSLSHQFIWVRNIDELEQQLARAHTQNKLLLIDYYADWCTDCIRMEKNTFANARVKAVLDEKFITVKIDVTDPQDADGKALKRRFGVFGPPAVLFIGRDGTLLEQMNFYGYMESDALLSRITAL